ncbi:MAG: hypothetical protein ACXU9K_12810, partial [Thermodesulfobacteriota bacterium]
ILGERGYKVNHRGRERFKTVPYEEGLRSMRAEFLGGVKTLTGSPTLLEKCSLKWLAACLPRPRSINSAGPEPAGRDWNLPCK